MAEDAGLLEDARAEDANLPDARDAAVPDAGDVVDADAGPIDASDSGDAQEDAGEPPDLAFIRTQGFASSLHVLNVSDFSAVRRLDPEPTHRFDLAFPVGYTPDGRKLLIQEESDTERRFFVSYPCRAASCPQAPSYQVAVAESNAQFHGVQIAPDSSGIVLSFDHALWYVALGPERAEPAVRLLEGRAPLMTFLRGGSALLVLDEERQRNVVFDLTKAASGSVTPHVLEAHIDSFFSNVAPDGEHFLLRHDDFNWYAYTTADVLADRATRRKLASVGAEISHVTNTRVVVHDEGFHAVRWSGDDPVALPIQNLIGCEQHAIACSNTGKTLHFMLPGAATQSTPLALTEVPGLPCENGRFAPACTHFFTFPGPDALLYDLSAGTLVSAAGLTEISFFDDGRLLYDGAQGLTSVLRTTGPTLSTAFVPRKPLINSMPALAQHSAFLVTTGSLEKALDPGLYQVDMSGAEPARLRRLRPERMEVRWLQLSADDRYLVYRADAPEVPSAWNTGMAGVFEIDLQTGVQTRISPPAAAPAGGPSWMAPFPGEHALLVSGQYDATGGERFYVAKTRPDAWIAQTPAERQTWTNIMGGAALLGTGTERLLAGMGVSPQGPGVWLQTLSLDPGAPAKQLGSYVDTSFDGAYAHDASLWPLGVAKDLGLLFGQGLMLEDRPVYRALQRIEPNSGKLEPVVSATGEIMVKRMGQHTGRAFIQRRDDPGDYDYGYVEAAQPQRWISLLKANVSDALSPDERWLVYSEVGSFELHCYDLDTRTHHALPLPSSIAPPNLEDPAADALVIFTDESHALIRLDNQELHELSLSATPHLRGVIIHVSQYAFLDASADFSRFVSFGDGEGVNIYDRDGTRRELLAHDIDRTTRATISPNGRIVLAHYRGEPWRAYDLERPTTPPVVLRDAHHERMRFDRSARYVLGTDWTDLPSASVWELAKPDQPHDLGAGAAVTDAVFLE